VKVTLPDASEQPDEYLSNITTTVSLDVAEALGVYEPRSLPAPGAPPTEMVLDVVPAADAAEAPTREIPEIRSADVAPIARIRPNGERLEKMLKVRSI
jgi:hypothetical protein